MAYDPFAGMPGREQYPGQMPYLGPAMPGQTPQSRPDTPASVPELIQQQNTMRGAQQPNNDWRANQMVEALRSMGYTPTLQATNQNSSWLSPQRSYTVKLSEFPDYEFGIPYGQGQFDPYERAKYMVSEAQRRKEGMYAQPAVGAGAQAGASEQASASAGAGGAVGYSRPVESSAVGRTPGALSTLNATSRAGLPPQSRGLTMRDMVSARRFMPPGSKGGAIRTW